VRCCTPFAFVADESGIPSGEVAIGAHSMDIMSAEHNGNCVCDSSNSTTTTEYIAFISC